MSSEDGRTPRSQARGWKPTRSLGVHLDAHHPQVGHADPHARASVFPLGFGDCHLLDGVDAQDGDPVSWDHLVAEVPGTKVLVSVDANTHNPTPHPQLNPPPRSIKDQQQQQSTIRLLSLFIFFQINFSYNHSLTSIYILLDKYIHISGGTRLKNVSN